MRVNQINLKTGSLFSLALAASLMGCGPTPMPTVPKTSAASVTNGSSSTSSSGSDSQNVAATTTTNSSSTSSTSTSGTATSSSTSSTVSSGTTADTATTTQPAGRPSCTVTQPTLLSAGNGQYYLQTSATVTGPVQVAEVSFSLSTMVGGYSVPVGISKTAPYTITYLDSLGAAGYTSTLYVTVKDQNGNYYPNLCGTSYGIRWN